MAVFDVHFDDGRIEMWAPPNTNPETLHHLLLDQVLPRLLAHQGHIVLHAGAVAMNDRAVAFVGTTGAGKSSLVASLHATGVPLLSDDGLIVRLNGDAVEGLATYASLRLWPDALEGLYPNGAPACAPMAHYTNKQRLLLDEHEVVRDARQLAALYVIASGDEKAVNHVAIEPLSPRDTCMALISNAFQLDPTDHDRARDLLTRASDVAERLPAFRLTYPRGYDRLPEVRAALLEHQAALAPTTDEGARLSQ